MPEPVLPQLITWMALPAANRFVVSVPVLRHQIAEPALQITGGAAVLIRSRQPAIMPYIDTYNKVSFFHTTSFLSRHHLRECRNAKFTTRIFSRRNANYVPSISRRSTCGRGRAVCHEVPQYVVGKPQPVNATNALAHLAVAQINIQKWHLKWNQCLSSSSLTILSHTHLSSSSFIPSLSKPFWKGWRVQMRPLTLVQ